MLVCMKFAGLEGAILHGVSCSPTRNRVIHLSYKAVMCISRNRSLLLLHLGFFQVCSGSRWLYNFTACTGLGDRLGIIVSLSALARLHDSSVFIEWCVDPERACLANPLHRKFIPEWTGWEYPLQTVFEHIAFPGNVEFFLDGRPPPIPWKMVTFKDQALAVEGISSTSTLYWKALKFTNKVWNVADYRQAYLDAGKEIVSKAPAPENCMPYVLVHFRCPDRNTFRRDERSLCTRDVVRKLQAAGVNLRIISNDYDQTLPWLYGLHPVSFTVSGTAWTDMQVSLGAAAIVQHASGGWSSYTSVPAMAKEIPLINTYYGAGHRYSLFSQYGDIPPEFMTCSQTDLFVDIAVNLTRRAPQGTGRGWRYLGASP
jgi:hypothetical protein